MTESPRGFDRGVLGVLLGLNLLVHFVPLERPGFQPDDFVWLQLARAGDPWSFIGVSLSQGMRPLGSLLFMLLPYTLGLDETRQLLVLIATTSLLTLLGYVYLAGMLSRSMAALAALVFVLWPVKHEIYASQLFGVSNLAAAFVIGAGLLYRRWARTSRSLPLVAALFCYGLSIFIYEIGYLAPVLFYLAERTRRPRPNGALLFLIPAGLYWAVRLTHPDVQITIGRHEPGLATLGVGLASLPSNLFGFQLLRNIGYGLFGVWSGPLWFQLFCATVGVAVSVLFARWIKHASIDESSSSNWRSLVSAGFFGAVILAAPAALILVESRHSVLASIGMGIAVAGIATRLKKALGAAIILVLFLAAQGLAWRQAEVSQLQAAVQDVITQRQEEIRSASMVVFDIASLADRVAYTWGDRTSNVLRGYWGLHAFSAGGFASLVENALYRGAPSRGPRVTTCASGLVISEATVDCAQEYGRGRPFSVSRPGTLVIDFKTMPLPSSLDLSSSIRR